MKIEYDPAKNQANIAKHGIDFEQVRFLNWDLAKVNIDNRFDYGEVRYIAILPLVTRLHIICFTLIEGGIRVISFRKANKREVTRYENQ